MATRLATLAFLFAFVGIDSSAAECVVKEFFVDSVRARPESRQTISERPVIVTTKEPKALAGSSVTEQEPRRRNTMDKRYAAAQ